MVPALLQFLMGAPLTAVWFPGFRVGAEQETEPPEMGPCLLFGFFEARPEKGVPVTCWLLHWSPATGPSAAVSQHPHPDQGTRHHVL